MKKSIIIILSIVVAGCSSVTKQKNSAFLNLKLDATTELQILSLPDYEVEIASRAEYFKNFDSIYIKKFDSVLHSDFKYANLKVVKDSSRYYIQITRLALSEKVKSREAYDKNGFGTGQYSDVNYLKFTVKATIFDRQTQRSQKLDVDLGYNTFADTDLAFDFFSRERKTKIDPHAMILDGIHFIRGKSVSFIKKSAKEKI